MEAGRVCITVGLDTILSAGEEQGGKRKEQGEAEQVAADERDVFPEEIKAGDQEIIISIKNAQQQDIGNDIPLRGRIGEIRVQAQ